MSRLFLCMLCPSGTLKGTLGVLMGLLAASLLIFAAAPVAADKSLVIDNFHSDIAVHADAGIVVTETITLHFSGYWNGIYRTIPVQYRTPQGFNYELLLDMYSITDDADNELNYESRRRGQYQELKIYIPGAVDTARTIILRYQVRNALKFFPQHDELYWNITGDEWEMPIRYASATIRLPEKVTGVRATAFTGGYGSSEQAALVQTEKNTVSIETQRPLNFREGLTVGVAWNPGVVHRPTPLERIASFLRANWVFCIPLLALVCMYYLWATKGRDPRLRPIAPQYEPPEAMTPAEVGTLVDNVPNMPDITATIVDLAVRGYLVIEEQQTEGFLGLGRKKEYTFTLKKKEPEWSDLQPHEREMLQSMFLGDVRQSVTLSELENNFYRHLPHIRDLIYQRLIMRHYYTSRPDEVKRNYLIGAAVPGIAAIIASNAGLTLGTAYESVIVAGILTSIVIAAFGWFMPARTYKGARALEGVLGFEEFLGRVESDRLGRVVKTPEMFEKFLPYAMALGVEKNWARAFADIYKEPPQWYQGSSFPNFYLGSFVSDLGHMSTQAASVMTSAPRSSGGSAFGGGGFGGGFGGGGFSGGGFGGGGGRGF